MKYKATVLDDIGNIHPRKHLRLKERGVLEERLAEASKKEQALIRSEIKKLAQRTHPYDKELKEAKDKERNFLQGSKKRQQAFAAKIETKDRQIKKWQIKAAESKERQLFYSDLIDLSYDFELKHNENLESANQLGQMAEKREKILTEIFAVNAEVKNLEQEDLRKSQAEYLNFRSERRQRKILEITELKKLHKDGLISAKAMKNGQKTARLSATEDIQTKKRLLPDRRLKDKLRNLKHQLRTEAKTGIKLLNSDISDMRRKTPVETTKRYPWISWLTFPLPGLGQLLLGQWQKAVFFLFGSAYTYFIALPYALGHGNYRGQGILGLISLAKDGSRLDRSIIFMIEGVIAVIFLLLALLIIYLSFRDVNKNEKREIKGIRLNNWFETKSLLLRDGFPYFTSAPAALVTIFIVLLPIAITILISFTNYDPTHQSKFNWHALSNFKQIIMGQGIAGGPFWLIAGWTIIWTVLATSLAIFIGFVLALLVNQERVLGKRFFRTVYLLPWAVPAFITIMFFSIMFSPSGPLTLALNNLLGNTSPTDMLNIKYTTWGTRIVLILLQGWLGSSYIFLLSTGILQGIPKDLYEAAEIDGATGFQRIRHITIPLLLFQTAPLLIGQYTFNFNNFSIIYLFNGGGPFEPSKYGNLAGSSDLLISYIYKLTIQKQYQGIGSAITVVVSIVLIFVTWIGFSRTKAFREEKL